MSSSGSASSSERHVATRRVFVSSTAVDLRAHRARVRDVLLSLGLFPVGMESFGAQGTGDAMSVSTDKVAGCDIYVGIIGWRYGYVPAGRSQSVTHQEYEAAQRLGMPRYLFLADPATDGPDGPDALFPATVRDPEHRAQLDAFRAAIGQAQVVDFFTTPDDLATRVATALNGYLLSLKEEELSHRARPPRSLPPRVSAFSGRKQEVAALCRTLVRGRETGQSAAVYGMPGVGKSALAGEVLHVLAEDPATFSGGVTWIRCEGRTGLSGLAWLDEQVLAAWGLALTPEESARAVSEEDAVALRERVLRQRLRPASATEKPAPALVLLDNVERDIPIGRALDTLTPLGITALLTARHEINMPQVALTHLDILPPDAAKQLFAIRYAGRGGDWNPDRDDEGTDVVVEALGRLPIAIELAAARAARSHIGVVALSNELREADRLGTLRDPVDLKRNVRYAFTRSLDLLTASQRMRFAALGLLDAVDWPRSLIERLYAAVPEQQEQATVTADLDTLVALSLVAVTEDEAGARVRLHPLLRDLAREEWSVQQAPVQATVLAALVASVADLVQARAEDFGALAREEDLIAGALRRAGPAETTPAALGHVVALLEPYLDRGGHWRLGLELSRLQLAAYQRVGDRVREAQALNNIGVLLQRVGNAGDAADFYRRALALRREVGDRPGEAETLSNLGGLLSGEHRGSEAQQYHEEALALRRALGDQRGEGTSLHNLGALAAEQGRDADARTFYSRALALRRAMGDKAGEGVTLNNLGGLAEREGNASQATDYYEQALAAERSISDRAAEAATLNNLGNLARTQERLDEAARYYEQALALRRAVDDRRGEGTTLHNLGILAESRGAAQEAVHFLSQALAAEDASNDLAGEVATLGVLGILNRRSGNLDAAAEDLQRAAALQKLTGDMRGQAATLAQLGEVQQLRGRGGDAAQAFQDALALQQAGGDVRGQGLTLNGLGVLAYARGRSQEAISTFQEAASLLDRVGDVDGARTARDNLARLASPAASDSVPSGEGAPAAPPTSTPDPESSNVSALPPPGAGASTPQAQPVAEPARTRRRWPWSPR